MFGWSENMSSVKSLPESVRSSVRSGIVLFDIARVVEELIFNCLDAHASKVSVFVGIGTCYVKVVDDGTGITRDGLELVGERYVTSKFNNLVDKDTENGSFGFRGEALASISDLSLLEIITKSHGRPNGYRKVMKGSKCLYLGICDDIKDVGTTVVARDLFYNQPVRRKYIQSSPKKVLQSVKKCVLRIALVHSKVSFKVVDTESDEIILCTQASSPASRMSGCFGIDVSPSLHELNINNGNLKLFGYISGPSDALSVKAFQYVYINSRFVSKGPIHKLVNQIASRFECNDLPKAGNGTKNRKRSRPQTYPSFILNISCPRSFYDLTFEPSKTYVEFKDWVPVLTFLEEAIQHLWVENISIGDSSEFATDVMGKDQILYGDDNAMFAVDLEDKFFKGSSVVGKRNQSKHEASSDPICSDLKFPRKEDSCMSHRKWDMSPIQHSHKYSGCYDEKEIELDFIHSDQLGDYPVSKCRPEVSRSCKNKTYNSNVTFLRKDDFSANEAICEERRVDSEKSDPFSLRWADDFFECSPGKKNESIGFDLTRDFQQPSDVDMIMDMTKPFLRSCLLRRTLPPESSLFTDSAHVFQRDGYKIGEILRSPYDRNYIPEVQNGIRSSDFSTRTLRQDQPASFDFFPSFNRKHCSVEELESLPGAFGLTIPFYEEQLKGKGGLSSGSVSKIETIGKGDVKLNSEWWSMASDSYSYSTLWDEELCNEIKGREGRSCKSTRNKHFINSEENGFRYGYNTTSCSSSGLEDSGLIHSHQRRGLNVNFSPKWADVLSDENDWLSFGSNGERHQNTETSKTQRRRNNLEMEDLSRISKVRIRSHSAPPLCKRKRRFVSLHCYSEEEPGKALVCPEARERLKSIAGGVSLLDGRQDLKKMPDLKKAKNDSNKDERVQESVCLIQDAAPLKETIAEEFQDTTNCWTKWRTRCSKTSVNNKLHNIHDQNNILDISSGFLPLAGDSLVPQSITKTCLEDAIVLQQVDKKYIPIVAGKTLAVVDQHAADERIRLEELRQKVLSGEAKTITYLEAEQELTLPEIGHQLLHNYAGEIKEWGWICNIHSHDSRSFKRSLNLFHRQPTTITLTAVPCILGVNLSDVDLMEFLQQLADTDGSSMIPPAVLRILNSKACRGAIMFGDSLLQSECSLLISELKRTSLCFQCAHGRPTTAPVVNLEALHKQIARISLVNDNNDSNELWHGLRRNQLSLERSQQRLFIAT